MRVTTSGNVGIGTGSPTGTLHVEGGIADGVTDGKAITLDAQDGGPDGGAGGNIVLLPGASGDGFAPDGMVGIGTDSPTLTLDVNGQIRIRGGSPFLGAVLTSDSDGSASWMSLPSRYTDEEAISAVGRHFTNDDEIDPTVDAKVAAETSARESVDSALQGNIDAEAGLRQDGDDANTVAITANTTAIAADKDPDPANELNSSVVLNGTTLEVTDAGATLTADLGGLSDNLGDHTATENISLMSFWLSGDGGSEGISIDSIGNVGIGTPIPQSKLDVNGAVRIFGGGDSRFEIKNGNANGSWTFTNLLGTDHLNIWAGA